VGLVGDILSQSEIDALLNSLGGDSQNIVIEPTEVKHEPKKYNFKMPSKFNKEQLRTLEIIFENYSRLVSSFLSGYLRTTVHMEVADASQLAFKEFSNTLFNPDVLGIVKLKPLKGSIILEISPSIGFAIIDRILGGPGQGLKRMRGFSDIEQALLSRVVTQLLEYMPETWENVVHLEPRLEKLETNPQFAQLVSPTEIVALITLTIRIGDSEGFVNFCLPNLVLDSVMDKLYTKYWFNTAGEEGTEAYQDEVQEQLEKAKVPIIAVVGGTQITVNDFINLQVGDIIPLDSYINSDIKVMVGFLHKFFARPGLSRGKNAIQITSVAGN
jgi:flagellar motor switch protein FliM